MSSSEDNWDQQGRIGGDANRPKHSVFVLKMTHICIDLDTMPLSLDNDGNLSK